MSTTKALAAELIGTFAVVLATCGAGMLAAPAGLGMLAPAIAMGLSMTVLGYALGHVSGAHLNPAVTVGLIAAGRFDGGNAIGYIIAQVAGGILAVLLLQVVLGGAMSAGPTQGASWGTLQSVANSYGGLRGFSLVSAVIVEAVATALLLVVIVGATSRQAPAGLAPLATGLALGLLYLLALPVTNASLNPARSTAPAVLAGGAALSQLWVFWVAPIVGALVGGAIGRWLADES